MSPVRAAALLLAVMAASPDAPAPQTRPAGDSASPAGKGVVCPICGMVNCTMGCKATGVDAAGRKVMVMPGLPDWLFYAGVAGVLVASFVVAEVVGRRQRTARRWRFNLLRFPPLKAFVMKPWFQFALQVPMAVLFVLLICAGLFGHQVINITPTITWTIWWAGLTVLVLFGGKVWCMICPWDLIATVLSRLRLWGTGPGALNLGLKWPRVLGNIGPAIGLFIVLTWFELGYHITASPMHTAYMAIGILLLTIVSALLFERKGWCRHACFVGRITGLYACFSPVEVRAADKEVCRRNCTTRDCYRGNERGNPCPTGLCLAALVDNTYCLKCCECARSCPHDNVAVNLRPFGEDLFEYSGPRLDEAILSIVLLALTSFHGLTMTPLWDNPAAPEGTVVGFIRSATGLGRLGAFTLGMGGILAAPILLYVAFCFAAHGLAKWLRPNGSPRSGQVGVGGLFIRFSYSVLPIALFYHVAHSGMHLFMEGQNVFQLASDPIGRGWDLFGTAGRTFPPILGKDTIWVAQVFLVLIGHVFGIAISQRVAQQIYGRGRIATVVQVPLLAAMIVFSFFSLWLMHLDMNMRGTLM